MTKEQFKIFFDEHFDSLRRYLYFRCGYEEIATDAAQDTFMKFWEKQFDIVSNPNQSKGLLYKIANDILISHLRKNKLESNHIDKLSLELSNNVNTNTPEETLHYQELKNQYEITLAQLPEGQRSVFLMSRMEGLTYREISERLNLSVKAIEKRMSSALSVLKQKILK